jgi:hypothetical protein
LSNRLLALENAAGIHADLTMRIRKVSSVAEQSAGRSKFAPIVVRRNRMTCGKRHHLIASAQKEHIGCDEQRGGALSNEGCESCIDVVLGPGMHAMSLRAQCAGRFVRILGVGLGVRIVLNSRRLIRSLGRRARAVLKGHSGRASWPL